MYEIIDPPVLSIQICDLSLGRHGYIVPTSSMYQGDTQPIVEFDWERILVYKREREREREYHFISQRDHVIGRTTAVHCCINTAHRMLCDARNGTRQHMGGKIPFRRIPVLGIFVRFTHGQNLSFVKIYIYYPTSITILQCLEWKRGAAHVLTLQISRLCMGPPSSQNDLEWSQRDKG